jgi:hypothetical protein
MIDARVAPARHDGNGSISLPAEQEAVKIMTSSTIMVFGFRWVTAGS